MGAIKTLDVVGIGNAIVDVLAYTDDAFINDQGMTKGGMMLVTQERAQSLYAAMGPATECSGGSVANTLAGLAGLGAKTAFIGKVFDDQLGAVFRHDMQAIGVRFDTPAATRGKATGVCMIFVTPDAQRTMNTFIGACSSIERADIDEALVASARVLYLEGYLWDEPETKEALLKAARVAKQNKTKVAFSLSDGFCVDRHREEFTMLIKDHVDILFANESEVKSLTQKETFDEALKEVKTWVELAVLTRSEKGSHLLRGSVHVQVKAEAHGPVVDSTGAGDLYAAGVLYGLTHEFSLKAAGELGSNLAGHIITQLGARSQKPLKPLLDAVRAA